MRVQLHRFVGDGKCYCLACWPSKKSHPCDDTRVLIKARPYVSCSKCGAKEEVAPDRPPTPEGVRFREAWAKEVADGKALPIAGDLLDGVE